MKTTVDIPEAMLQAAIRYSNARTKREAVLKALEEFNRTHAQAGLAKYLGTFKSLMSNEEIEGVDAPVVMEPSSKYRAKK